MDKVEDILKNNMQDKQIIGEKIYQLHLAIEHAFPIINDLINSGVNRHELDETNKNAIHTAVRSYPNVIEELVNLGVNINHQDERGITPLMYSFENGVQYIKQGNFKKISLCQYMIGKGARIDLKDNFGDNILFYAALHNPEEIPFILNHAKINSIKLDFVNTRGQSFLDVIKMAHFNPFDTIKKIKNVGEIEKIIKEQKEKFEIERPSMQIVYESQDKLSQTLLKIGDKISKVKKTVLGMG